MRRLCATLLLAVFGYPLILPAIRVENETKLPSCCRREGKHHCGMASTENSGPAVREKCPNFTGVSAAPAFSQTVLLNAAQAFFSGIARHPSVHSQTEALQRISFSRSRQKRGPPTLLS